AIVALDIRSDLEVAGYTIVGEATSGAEALRQVATARPDIVLLDICLKGPQDGIAVARAIRDQFDIPVVFLSAFFDKDTLQRASQVEPYGYLTKPFDERDLHATLQMALAKAQADRELQHRFDDLLAVLDIQLQGTVLLDSTGCVTFLSQAAQRM